MKTRGADAILFCSCGGVLGRLASIFLQEEKGRIHRLRQIKSVLASGKLMGNVGGNTSSSSTTQPDRRGKRRPLPNVSQHHGHHSYNTTHRRFQHADVKPNYPANPFGNVGSDIQQLPTPNGRRSSLEEALRGGRNEVNAHAQHRNDTDSSETVQGGDGRAIAEQVLGGSTQSLYGSRSDLVLTTTTGDDSQFLHSQHTEGLIGSDQADEKGQRMLQGLVSHNTSRVVAEESQEISTGQSAIDLFDQCGIVPMAAVEKEGLVGTTSTYHSSRESGKQDSTGRNNLGTSTTDGSSPRYPITEATVALPRPPLVPGGTSSTVDFRGAGNHPRDPGRGSAMRTQAATTHGVRPRPIITNGGASTSSRTKFPRQQAPSLSSGTEAVAGTSRPNGKLRRGAPKNATTTDSSSRRSRMVPRLNGENRSSAETSMSIPKPDRRTRRRWNVDAASPTGASSSPPAPPGVAAAAATAAGSDAVESESPSASASEQRVASAKERLHKNKDLEALKSEHVEALSILQDISCPSTAAVASEATRGESAEETDGGKTKAPESAVEATRRCLLYERKNSSTTTTGGSHGREVTLEGMPADVEVDQLSADLPRIGSQEQAALRAMYRKWWMKVANGGSPPSLGTPAGPLDDANNAVEGDNASLADCNPTGERGIAPVVGQQELPVQRRVMTGTTEGQAGRSASDVRNIVEVNGAEGPSGSVARTEPEKMLSESEKPDLVRPHTHRGAEASALEKSGDGSKTSFTELENSSSNTPLTELEGTRAKDGIITKHCKEPATSVGAKVGTTGVPKAAAPATAGEPETSSKEEAANTVESIMQHTSAGVPPTKDGAGGTRLSSSSSPAEQQAAASDVDSVSEDDGLEKEQEEGHHGRIYLADGRFVSTLRNSAEGTNDAVKHLNDLDIVDGGDNRTGSSCEVVVDESAAKGLDDVSMGYADEDFEFED